MKTLFLVVTLASSFAFANDSKETKCEAVSQAAFYNYRNPKNSGNVQLVLLQQHWIFDRGLQGVDCRESAPHPRDEKYPWCPIPSEIENLRIKNSKLQTRVFDEVRQTCLDITGSAGNPISEAKCKYMSESVNFYVRQGILELNFNLKAVDQKIASEKIQCKDPNGNDNVWCYRKMILTFIRDIYTANRPEAVASVIKACRDNFGN